MLGAALLGLHGLSASAAQAQDPSVAAKVRGHLGFALPLLTIASETTAIGADFVNVGVTPGITVKLSDRWAVDFEFIAFNAWSMRHHHGDVRGRPGCDPCSTLRIRGAAT